MLMHETGLEVQPLPDRAIFCVRVPAYIASLVSQDMQDSKKQKKLVCCNYSF
jgi:hypothetical protein